MLSKNLFYYLYGLFSPFQYLVSIAIKFNNFPKKHACKYCFINCRMIYLDSLYSHYHMFHLALCSYTKLFFIFIFKFIALFLSLSRALSHLCFLYQVYFSASLTKMCCFYKGLILSFYSEH